MSIYTKKGDAGKSSLPSWGELSKGQPIFEFLGSLDELNATIGLAISFLENRSNDIRTKLEAIQSALLIIGGVIATGKTGSPRLASNEAGSPRLASGGEAGDLEKIKTLTKEFEKQIDEWDKVLPPLNNFILPNGTKPAATLQIARAITRRGERALSRIVLPEDFESIQPFINRLSDYLFVMARYINFRANTPDKLWNNK